MRNDECLDQMAYFLMTLGFTYQDVRFNVSKSCERETEVYRFWFSSCILIAKVFLAIDRFENSGSPIDKADNDGSEPQEHPNAWSGHIDMPQVIERVSM